VYLAIVTNRALIIPNVLGHDFITTVDPYEGKNFWPGFRILHIKPIHGFHVDIVEPAFYWRVQRDYSPHAPDPKVITFASGTKLKDMESQLMTETHPRLVLNVAPRGNYSAGVSLAQIERLLQAWAIDSVGTYEAYKSESRNYFPMPRLNKSPVQNSKLAYNIIQDTRLCSGIFERMKGNRSCFDKCD
jgi:hypothetical protein